MKQEPSLSVDKLSLTFKVHQRDWEEFRRRMHRRDWPRPGGQTYREALEIPDPAGTGQTLLMQWAPRWGQVPFGRIEWNPTKSVGWVHVLAQDVWPFLRRGWDSTHVTRVDVAVDYPVDLRAHVYYARNQKASLHYTREGIETFYLGSPRSNRRFRIYDKRKELEAQGELIPLHPLTRIEVQQRSTGLPVNSLDNLPNPFEVLGMEKAASDQLSLDFLPDGLPFEYQLYMEKAREWGVDAVRKRLNRCKRERLMEAWKEIEGQPVLAHPALVFNTAYRKFCEEHLAIFFR